MDYLKKIENRISIINQAMISEDTVDSYKNDRDEAWAIYEEANSRFTDFKGRRSQSLSEIEELEELKKALFNL